MPRGRRVRYALLATLTFVFITRVGWMFFAWDVSFSDKDQADFEDVALSIVHHGELGKPTDFGFEPAFFRPPGYPLFIAAIYGLAGDRRPIVTLVQSVLGVATAALAFGVGRRLWTDAVGVAGAAFVALDPVLFWYDHEFASEALATLLVTGLAYAGVRALVGRRRDALRWWAVAGVLLVVATFVRPTTYFFPIVGAGLVMAALRRSPRRHRLAAAAALVVPSIVACGAWQVRNTVVAGSSRFTGVEGYNMLALNGAAIVARDRGITLNEAQDAVLAEIEQRRPDERVGEFDDRLYEKGLDIVTGDPLAFAWTRAGAAWHIAIGTSQDILPFLAGEAPPGTADVLHLQLFGTWALAIVGVAGALRSSGRRWAHAWALGLLTYVIVMSALGGGSYFRFRAPVAPILALYAGAGAWHLLGWVRARRPGPSLRQSASAGSQPWSP